MRMNKFRRLCKVLIFNGTRVLVAIVRSLHPLKEYDNLCGVKRKYISTRKMAHIRLRADDRQKEKVAKMPTA